MKKTIKIAALAAAGALALTGCSNSNQENINIIQLSYKGVDKGLTCIDAHYRLTCDYVDFYNKYPHLKSEPLTQQ